MHVHAYVHSTVPLTFYYVQSAKLITLYCGSKFHASYIIFIPMTLMQEKQFSPPPWLKEPPPKPPRAESRQQLSWLLAGPIIFPEQPAPEKQKYWA